MDSWGCWKLLNHADLKLKKQVKLSHPLCTGGFGLAVGHNIVCTFPSAVIGFEASGDCRPTPRVNEGGGDSGP